MKEGLSFLNIYFGFRGEHKVNVNRTNSHLLGTTIDIL